MHDTQDLHDRGFKAGRRAEKLILAAYPWDFFCGKYPQYVNTYTLRLLIHDSYPETLNTCRLPCEFPPFSLTG